MAALLTTPAHLEMRDMLDRLIVLSIVFKTDLHKPLGGNLCIGLHLGRCSSLIALGVFGLEIGRCLIDDALIDWADREKVTRRLTSGTAFTDAAIDVNQLAIIRRGAINRVGATGIGIIAEIYGVGGRIGIGA